MNIPVNVPSTFTTRTTYAGLDIVHAVAQSALCHPDWQVADHVGYLVFEEDFECTPALVRDVENLLAWKGWV